MKNLLALVILIVLFQSIIKGQSYDKCSDFLNGKFTYPLLPEGSGYDVRNGNEQVSFLNNGDKQLVWNVEWINECNYILTLKEIYGVNRNWVVGDVIRVEINSFKNNCYGYKSVISAKKFAGDTVAYDMMCKEPDL